MIINWIFQNVTGGTVGDIKLDIGECYRRERL